MGLQELVDVFAFHDARRGQGMSSDFEHYMAVKRAADIAVATSSLDWVIVRPGTLTDEPARGVRLA